MSLVLAYDLGGSSIRVALVAPDGAFVASERRALQIEADGKGRFEADPETWWDALVSACTSLASVADLARVSAIAGCGFTRTQVFLDRDGAVLRPAITFQDSRAAGLVESLRDKTGLATLGPFDPLARILWVRQNEPEVWSRLAQVLEPKDDLNRRLTGRAVSDTISQAPMARLLSAAPGLLAQLGVAPDLLPNALSPFDPVGEVRSGLPGALARLAGVPVFTGSIDTWACVLGSGALVPGVAYAISGTSDVSGVISATRHQAEGLLTVQWGADLWQLGGPSQGAATRLDWAMQRFFPDANLAQTLTEAMDERRGAPLFLPYLDGERTPFWDSGLRGAFLGLTGAHEGRDMLRAVAEGMNYLARDILARAESAVGTPVSHVCFSGGLSAIPALCQLKADVLGRTVLVPRNHETGLMGAVRVALGKGGASRPPAGRRYTPEPRRHATHDERFALFREAGAALTPLSHALARME